MTSSNRVLLAVDEDQLVDEERAHTTERLSLMLWGERDDGGSNRPPVAIVDHAETVAGQEVVVAVLENDNDPDSDELRIASVGTPDSGTVTHSETDLRYTPHATFTGTAVFAYVVQDGRGGFATGSVQVLVRAAESVLIVDAPALIRAPGRYEIAIAYVANREGDLVLRLIDAAASNSYGSVRTEVDSGDVSMPMDLMAEVPSLARLSLQWDVRLVDRGAAVAGPRAQDLHPVFLAPEVAVDVERSASGTYTVAFAHPPEQLDYTVYFRDSMDEETSWVPLPDPPHNDGVVVDAVIDGAQRRYYRIEISVRNR